MYLHNGRKKRKIRKVQLFWSANEIAHNWINFGSFKDFRPWVIFEKLAHCVITSLDVQQIDRV